MDTFKRGDSVTHAAHGMGDVLSVDTALKLVEVVFYFKTGVSIITVHPISLTKTA